MADLKNPLRGEHPIHKTRRDLEHATALLQNARTVAADKDDGPVLVRSLERETEALDAEYKRQLADFANGTPTGRLLAKGQPMLSAPGSPTPNVSLTGLVRGLGLGDWRGVTPDVKAMVLSGGAAAAVPGYVTAGIVDLAREQSVIFRAGAQLMPIDVPGAKVARMTSEPAVEWEPESAARDLTDGAWTFDAAELTADSAWLYTTLSVESVEDCVDLDGTIHRAFASQLSLAFDQAALAGSGAEQPLGLLNMNTGQDRIIEMLAVGVLADFRPFVQAMGLVKAAHHEPTSIIMPVETWTGLNCMQDGDNNPLRAPRAYQDLAEYVSGFLPADGGIGTDEHTVVVGDLSKLTVGVRTDITIEVSRLGAGFKKGAVEVRGYVRFGTYLTDPTAIAVLRGITLAEEQVS
ncbi:MAG: phage major capsid protein [Thermoleophilia bacterium]